MNLNVSINKQMLEKITNFFAKRSSLLWITLMSALLAAGSTIFSYYRDYIIGYGDAESHLNIAKRVIDSITPGFAQLGGIWLPLPHLLMLPFIQFDFLWRTGLAGSIISGLSFIVAAVFIYKTAYLITQSRTASYVAALVFMINPNVLYLQSTPMTEMVLIAFFTLSSYFFIKFLKGIDQTQSLLLAALFGFCSVLTRYDGWFLVVLEAGCILLYYFPFPKVPWRWTDLKSYFTSPEWKKAEGYAVMFATLAFFGILIWLVWDYLILGDPLYFTHSEFSAKSQQNAWLSKGQLPAYGNIFVSFIYYLVTAMSNAGIVTFGLGLVGLGFYLQSRTKKGLLVLLVLAAPFLFNVITQYLGQSVIFIPHLTPVGFEWRLFNVRYGVMSVPLVAVMVGYLFYKVILSSRLMIIGLMVFQLALYGVGYSKVISWADGTEGLSSAKRPDAERWLKTNYDFGLVLMDDYARTVSVVRSGIPMEEVIYIGNRPYWEESLQSPEKYARWIVMQENDSVWKEIWADEAKQGRLYKYFEKVYTSPEILIFRKQPQTTIDRPVGFWPNQCVDTMKYSRDAAREYIQRSDFDFFLEQEMTLIQKSGANCVAIGTPYDEEFVPYLTAWVNKARQYNLRIWFRGNMSGWEGWFDYDRFTNTEQHREGVANLITKHPELFKQGDIFTPAPEPENGILGDPQQSVTNRENFVKFLPEAYDNCVQSFAQINISVTCGYFSVNGDVANEIFTKDLLDKTGNVLVIDHYVSSPQKLIADIQDFNKRFGVPIMLGEFGAPIPDIHGSLTDDEQAEFIENSFAELFKNKNIVAGVNYWVLRGGSTSVVNDGSETRPAFGILQKYFRPAQIKGTVMNSLKKPQAGVIVEIPEYGMTTKTDSLGKYSLVVPARDVQVKISDPVWWSDQTGQHLLNQQQLVTQDFIVEPYQKSFWYKVKAWFAHF